MPVDCQLAIETLKRLDDGLYNMHIRVRIRKPVSKKDLEPFKRLQLYLLREKQPSDLGQDDRKDGASSSCRGERRRILKARLAAASCSENSRKGDTYDFENT